MSVLTGKRVLLLEDEPLVSMAAEDLLADLGCTIAGPAHRVDQAIATIAREPIDAAVLDLNIAGERSYPVAALLKARGVPFLFCSGYGDGVLPPELAGVPTVPKPYTADVLAEALERLFN